MSDTLSNSTSLPDMGEKAERGGGRTWYPRCKRHGNEVCRMWPSPGTQNQEAGLLKRDQH